MEGPKKEPEMSNKIETISVADLTLEKEEKEKILDEVVQVEKRAWPPELQASREKFASRMEIFPEGFLLARIDGKIAGTSTTQVTSYDPERSATWDEVTDNGMIRNTHDPKGNALYVVSVGVAKDFQGKGVGGDLVEAQKELARKLGLHYLFLGARIPFYDQYCKEHGEIEPSEYLKLRNERGEPYDPEIRFYKRRGLEPAKVIADFEPDDQSRDFGVVMVWTNPSK